VDPVKPVFATLGALAIGALAFGLHADSGVELSASTKPAPLLIPSGPRLDAPVVPEPLPEAPPAVSVETLMRGQSEPVACAADAELPPHVRVVALKRLARTNPDQALDLALSLLDSEESLVRTNAIAVLAKHPSPRARDALSKLDDPRAKRLATVLANRR